MSDDPNADPTAEESIETDGRCIEIDTGFYRVQVWGDPADSFAEVAEQAADAAGRAKADAIELDDRIDDDGRHYR